MARVTRCVEEKQGPAVEIEAKSIRRFDNEVRINGAQVAIYAPEFCFPINRHCTGDKPGGIGHVPRTPGMHHQLRIPKPVHEFTRAASMVEMYVGEEHINN